MLENHLLMENWLSDKAKDYSYLLNQEEVNIMSKLIEWNLSLLIFWIISFELPKSPSVIIIIVECEFGYCY